MKTVKIVGLLALAATVSLGAQPKAADLFPLRGVVVGETGRPLSGVEIEAFNDAREVRGVSDAEGAFTLELPAGVYTINFSHPDHYPTSLREVEVKIVKDPKLRNPNVGEIRVLMSRKLTFELDLVVQGPHVVEAPSLQVSFAPDPARQYQPVSGVLTVKNIGDRPVMLPVKTEKETPEGYTPDSLLMQVQVEIPGGDARYDEPFVCKPSQDCRVLGRSESVSIPIRLMTRSGYAAGRADPQVYSQTGRFKGSAKVYLVLPGGSETPTYTKPVGSEFVVVVK